MELKEISKKLTPKLNKFANYEFIKVLSQGSSSALSVVIIGSVFNMLKNPPVTSDMTNGFMLAWKAFSVANADWLSLGYKFSMDFMALYAGIAAVIALCQIKKKRPMNYIIMALFGYLTLACPLIEGGIDASYLAANGLFPAIIVCYLLTKLLIFLQDKGIVIKLPDVIPPSISDPLMSLFANLIVTAVVIAVYLLFANLGTSVPAMINEIFKPLFSATDSLPAVIIYILLVRLLWFFGIHGDNIGKAVVRPILAANLAANAEAWAANEPMPHIFTQAFNFWTYAPYLAMALAMLIVAKSSQNKTVSKVTLIPAIFNISEPITFGFPLVMNFQLLLPTLAVFVISVALPYIVYMNELFGIQIPYIAVIGTMPCIFLSFLTSFDFKNVILYLIVLIIDIIILIPAFKAYDNKLLAAEKGITQDTE